MSVATVFSDGTVLLGPYLSRLERKLAVAMRRRRSQPCRRVEAVTFQSTVGYQISAFLHLPDSTGPHPAVVLCADHLGDAATLVDPTRSVVTPDEFTAQGIACLRFDPSGRGESWGEDDLGGREHHDQAACATHLLAARPDIDPHRIGLIGLGTGSLMAIGAASSGRAEAAWVLDWEGPSDQSLMPDEFPAPTQHSDAFWRHREPISLVSTLTCAYVRLQSEQDHLRPTDVRHAVRMMDAAAAGSAPWVQINHHPPGATPRRPQWLRPGWHAANRAILTKTAALLLRS